MARGWESKSVEAQQEELARPKSSGKGRVREATPEERARAERRKTLELARARTLADLQSARATGHRAMLQRALDGIDEQLRDLA
jgi:hypothetical protein